MTVINYVGSFQKTSVSGLWSQKKQQSKIRSQNFLKLKKKSFNIACLTKSIFYSYLFFPVIFIFCFGVVYLWLITHLISLDFQVTRYKRGADELNSKISALKSESSDLFSPENITKWAKENGFQRVDKISHLNLGSPDLAKNNIFINNID